MENLISNITLEEQKRALITGVEEVLSFGDKEIKVKLKNGTKVVLGGEGFKISGFNKENGNFKAEGKIIFVKYCQKEESFIKKVFK